MKVAVILVLATMALLAQASDGPCPGVVSKLFNQYNPWIDSLRIACNNYRLWQYYLQYDDLCSGFFCSRSAKPQLIPMEPAVHKKATSAVMMRITVPGIVRTASLETDSLPWEKHHLS